MFTRADYSSMCCHTGKTQKSLHAALSKLDPALASADEFWHIKGREREGGVLVSREEAEKTLDAAFLAATAMTDDEESFEKWADVDAEERLEQHLEWMKARRAILEDGSLTQGQQAAIAIYVAGKNKNSVVQALANERADHDKTKNSRSRMKRIMVALGFIAVFGGMGWALAPSLADTTLPPGQEKITTQDNVNSLRSLGGSTFKVGDKIFYTKALKGQCEDGASKIKMAKTQKVDWERSNGSLGKKVVKKGVTVCKYVSKSGVTSEATYNSEGEITALPAGFPNNPTKANFEELAKTMTPDTKVKYGIQLPEPKSFPATRAADRVEPVSQVRNTAVAVGTIIKTPSGGSYTVETPSHYVTTTYRFTGGEGVVYAGKAQVTLNPSGTSTMTQTILRADSDTDYTISGELKPNAGQGGLPESLTSGWDMGSSVKIANNANGSFSSNMTGSGRFTLMPDGSFKEFIK